MRKGINGIPFLIIGVILALIVFVVLSPGLVSVKDQIFTAIGIGKSNQASLQQIDSFSSLCEQWRGSGGNQYNVDWILGTPSRQSIPSGAAPFGEGALTCCKTQELKDAAQNLRSKNGNLAVFSSGGEGWSDWSACFTACRTFINEERTCRNQNPGEEGSDLVRDCVNEKMQGVC